MLLAIISILAPVAIADVIFQVWTWDRARRQLAQERASYPETALCTRPELPEDDVLGWCVSEPTDQFRFHYGYCQVQVFGYPSCGGLYVLDDCTAFELEFLGYGRLDLPKGYRAKLREEEDAFCDKMRRLGAAYWERYSDYMRSQILHHGEPEGYVRVGWPETGGVWVLDTTVPEASEKGAALIKNAFTMEEYCRLIERLGGVFYANPRDCPRLALSSDN
ncbi:hypothetical protein BDW74DRAFT_175326 [Aspergillus multicolor]|uniref:uncharacterized protein n=1 Tax=Aspergillus multicolor TaxID=41759 RepID=UPI003CCE23F3